MTFELVTGECWDQRQVTEVAVIDVAAIDHEQTPAVFLATHQIAHVAEKPQFADSPGDDGVLKTEREVLAEFERDRGGDPHIAIVTGAQGTGKSHLVKWVYAQTRHHEDWHSVYIEKRNSNLKRVIETILAGLEGDEINHLREQLNVAHEGLRDVNEASDKIRTVLEHRCGNFGHEATGYEKQAREYLPALLGDPNLRSRFTAPEGAIFRIARLGLEDLRADEDEASLFFAEEDLQRIDASAASEASRLAQMAVLAFNGSPDLRRSMVKVLNDELGAAKKEVFLGAHADLPAVFDDVRVEIARRGKELALYIEDFTLLNGVDRDLAQVLTESAGAKGDRCRMRSIIAVTEGYLRDGGFETLVSRAAVYSMDIQLNTTVHAEEQLDFIGNYFNAIRIGKAGLDAAYDQHGTNPDREKWLVNKCATCRHMDECHSAFGTDTQGHGLYPLNATAVQRMIAKLSGQTAGRFDPRSTVRYVVRDALEVASAEIPEGSFPSAAFAVDVDARREQVSVATRSELKQLGPAGERYLSLYGFWMGLPSQLIDERIEPPAGLRSAFQLPEIGFSEPADNGEFERRDTGDLPDPAPPPLRTTDFDKWANGDLLPAPAAREVRNAVFDLLMSGVDNGPSGVRTVPAGSRRCIVGTLGSVDAVKMTQIEGGAGGGGKGLANANFTVAFERTERNAVMFAELVGAAKTGIWTDDAVFHQCMTILDEERERLVAASAASPQTVEFAARVVRHSSIAADESCEEVRRLELGFSNPLADDARSPKWTKWVRELAAARALALNIIRDSAAQRQGTGDFSIVDAALFAGAMRGRQHLDVGHRAPARVAEDLAEATRRALEEQKIAFEQQFNAVHPLIDRVGDQFSATMKFVDLDEAMANAIGEALAEGLLSGIDVESQLRSVAAAVPSEVENCLRTGRALETDKCNGIWSIMGNPANALQALCEYLDFAAQLLTRIEAAIEAGGVVPDEVTFQDLGVFFRKLREADAGSGSPDAGEERL